MLCNVAAVSVSSWIAENFLTSPQLSTLSLGNILASLLVALGCSLVIYFVYRLFYRGVVYNDNFNLLMILVALVTSFIIMTISSNLVLSLGMVGALSIVRFRAAVKDPLDVGFLFWAIAVGLTAGARLYLPAIIATLFVALVYILMTVLRKNKTCYLLILRYTAAAEEVVSGQLASISYRLKNKTCTDQMTELTLQVKVKNNDAQILERFQTLDGVKSVTLLEYAGDYAS
ncbi:MAG TPA: DUF4956 domain-containing protein [Firmicutes bacterium]|nr:DUF4956 domain-containing protein [Bacillota bacterium]